jgi:hypothetical protein
MATTHRGCATGFGNQNGYPTYKKGMLKLCCLLKATKTRYRNQQKSHYLYHFKSCSNGYEYWKLTFKLDDNGKKIISRFAN